VEVTQDKRWLAKAEGIPAKTKIHAEKARKTSIFAE